MEWKIVVGVVLPYVAVLVFMVGMLYRLCTWRKLASPTMTLFPAPNTEGGNTLNTLKEIVLFKSLFFGDRMLWFFAWVFHAVLALIVVGHFRVFTGLVDDVLGALGMSEEAVKNMSGTVGGAAGIVILLAVALLLIRRVTLQRVREISGAADYLALALIAAVIITGNLMRFPGEPQPVAPTGVQVATAPDSAALPEEGPEEGPKECTAGHLDLEVTRDYFAALATFSFSDLTPIRRALDHNVFFVHICLAFLLIVLIPFSKILHLGGMFFTHQLIRKQ